MEFSPDFATKKFQIPIAVRMQGTGDFDRCTEELKKLFQKETVTCFVRDCTFDGVYQPRLDRRPFVGIGNIGKILQLAGVPPISTLKQVRTAAAKVCSMSFEQIGSAFPALTNKTRKNLCFSMAYIYTLLTYGFGFSISDVTDPTGQMSQIEFSNGISGTKVDWALGAIIWEANQQPAATIGTYLKVVKDLDTSHIVPIGGDPTPVAEETDDVFSTMPDLNLLRPEQESRLVL
jgi:hypothetical protein